MLFFNISKWILECKCYWNLSNFLGKKKAYYVLHLQVAEIRVKLSVFLLLAAIGLWFPFGKPWVGGIFHVTENKPDSADHMQRKLICWLFMRFCCDFHHLQNERSANWSKKLAKPKILTFKSPFGCSLPSQPSSSSWCLSWSQDKSTVSRGNLLLWLFCCHRRWPWDSYL